MCFPLSRIVLFSKGFTLEILIWHKREKKNFKKNSKGLTLETFDLKKKRKKSLNMLIFFCKQRDKNVNMIKFV